MTVAIKEKVEGIRKVLKIWDKLSKRLPSTYPRASLVFHLSAAELMEYYFQFYECSQKERENPPYAFCDFGSGTIHVHVDMAEFTSKDIAWYLLHEVGHLYAFARYGKDDPRADDRANKIDERYANRFASRWVRRLRDDGWFA